MSVQTLAKAHAREQAATGRAASLALRKIWRGLDPTHIVGWATKVYAAESILAAAQGLVAGQADAYTTSTLQAQGIDAEASGQVISSAFSGVASDGRSLLELLIQPMVKALVLVDKGMSPRAAMAHGEIDLDMMARTQVADASRVATGVSMAARPAVQGYVRMLEGPSSCSRCILLAGKFYRWNDGFLRHPRCDCRHIPATENAAGDLRTDTKAYFNSLSEEQQDKVFGKAGARAIRNGADIYQIVNARQGIQTASILGRNVKITTVGNTRRSLAGSRLAREAGTKKVKGSRHRTAQAPRLMPEQIYQEAEREGWSRDEVLRQLRRFGYLF